MAHQPRTVEEKIARLATRSKGIVTRKELLEAGVTVDQVTFRLRNGLLIPVHRGVYRAGHAAPSTEATYLAAVKACGSDAYLLGRAAAYHQALTPLARTPPPPEVMCGTERRVQGVRTRHVRDIHPLEVAEYRGIPITTVPRTLLDFAATAPEEEVARAVHEAQVKHRTKPSYVLAVLDRHPRMKGTGKLRRALSGETPVTLSRLETRFLELLRAAAITPPPEVNRRAGSKRVDFRWPGVLTVELDSFTFHNSLYSWEQDRIREREARARREEFRRYTHFDVFEEPGPMLDEIRRLTATLGSTEGWQSG